MRKFINKFRLKEKLETHNGIEYMIIWLPYVECYCVIERSKGLGLYEELVY